MTGFTKTPEQTRIIETRIAQLRARLTPSPTNDRLVAGSLAKLFAAFPAQDQSGIPAEQRMEAYFEALVGVPAWAVDEARVAIVRGEAPGLNDTWMPTPPQLAKIARERLKTLQSDLADLVLIGQAQPIDEVATEAERDRVTAGLASLRDEIAASVKARNNDRAEARSAQMDAANEYFGKPDLPPTVTGFEAQCAEAGVDPSSVPDAPPRDGTMRKLPTDYLPSH